MSGEYSVDSSRDGVLLKEPRRCKAAGKARNQTTVQPGIPGSQNHLETSFSSVLVTFFYCCHKMFDKSSLRESFSLAQSLKLQ